MMGEGCTGDLLAENKEKVLFWQDDVAILKQDEKEWSRIKLCICLLEGSSHPAYLKITSFNGVAEDTMGGARQAKGARRVDKKKPNRLGPEKTDTFCGALSSQLQPAPSSYLPTLFCSLVHHFLLCLSLLSSVCIVYKDKNLEY